MSELKELGVRLAIRREGDFVNAYLARQGTMDDARLLASISHGIAENPEFFGRWKALMSDVLADSVKQTFGQKPTMIEKPAPESEREQRR